MATGQAKDDIELMQHADGELDERAGVEVRTRIEKDTDARTKVESLGQLSELVRGHLELAADSVPDRRFEGMWRTIARDIERHSASPSGDAARLGKAEAFETPESARQEQRAQTATPAPKPGAAGATTLWGRVSAWLDRHRGHVITGAVSAGAVAALALILRPAPTDHGSNAGMSPEPIQVQPARMRAAPVVESVDTPNGNAQILNLEDEDGHTTVIWITPADTVEGI